MSMVNSGQGWMRWISAGDPDTSMKPIVSRIPSMIQKSQILPVDQKGLLVIDLNVPDMCAPLAHDGGSDPH
tara:strand:- start:360 stop:572 length:213 start_codon:yes stop_codon:yes gene_type:complete